MEVPDRLPFEVAHRLFPAGVELGSEQHVQQPLIVMSTKGAGTMRPFVRLQVVDHLLYQALVDQLGETIEGALGPPDRIFAYRQNLDLLQENQFEGSPKWTDFNAAARARLEADPDAFCLKGDVSGYFMQINVDELERSLFERGGRPEVVRDAAELLRNWRMLELRGLPQGVPASAPLGNVFLAPIDEFLAAQDVEYIRYVDDTWIFTQHFDEARRAQDVLERRLYELGLSLSGEKSNISRRRTALERTRLAEEVVAAHQELFREGWAAMVEMDYSDEDELPPEQEINAAAVLDLYQDITAQLRQGVFPDGFRPLLRDIYRELASGRRPDVVGDVSDILVRFPDLTRDATLYVAYASEHDEQAALAAFTDVLAPERFHREQELLEIFRAALLTTPGSFRALCPRVAEFALGDPHPLVRARALLVWGAHSDPDTFDVADAFWRSAARMWRIYPFAAIQDKTRDERDSRYRDWSAEGRVLEQLGNSLMHQRFSWRKI